MTTWALTGATGFIGRHLVHRILEDGDQVRALVRPESAGAELPDGVQRLVVALDDEDGLEAALQGVDVVEHLAAPRRHVVMVNGRPIRAGGRPGDPAILVEASERLARAAGRARVRRMVVTSSTGVYGHPWTTVHEESPTRPITEYGRQRLEGERVTRQAADRSGLELVVARLSETFGPGGTSHAAFFGAVADGGFRVVGGGRQRHQMGYVEDTARALVACGRVPAAAGRIYLISGAEWSFRDLVESMGRAAGKAVSFTPFLGPPARLVARAAERWPWSGGAALSRILDYHLRPRSYDLSRTRADLGLPPSTPLDRAVAATMAWYRPDVVA